MPRKNYSMEDFEPETHAPGWKWNWVDRERWAVMLLLEGERRQALKAAGQAVSKKVGARDVFRRLFKLRTGLTDEQLDLAETIVYGKDLKALTAEAERLFAGVPTDADLAAKTVFPDTLKAALEELSSVTSLFGGY